jgi:hypothetical protein
LPLTPEAMSTLRRCILQQGKADPRGCSVRC